VSAAPFAIAGAVLGAIFGSFLATLILRWPAGRSVLRGRSQCDGCGRSLSPLELVPVVSAILLRGTCRICAAPIDPTHVRMEIGCAAIGGLSLALLPGVEGAGWAIFGWIILTLAVLDWRHMWLPDALTLPLAFLGLTLALWVNDVSPIDRAIGALVGYGGLLILSVGYRVLRGREGLGLGDAKLLGALGAWFGWQALPFVLLIASLAAIIVVAIRTGRGETLSRSSAIPLGTFLCIAALPGWIVTRLLILGA